MATTISSKANATDATITHYTCETCYRTGVSTHRDGFVNHRRDCSTKEQPAAETAAVATETATASTQAADLNNLASDVRRTAMTGRHSDRDLLDAVRLGYLSESAAMNSDD